MDISNNYRAELVRANLTDEDVIEAIGITRQALYNKKIGKSKFTGEEMREIRKLINDKMGTDFTTDYLFWGE